LDGESDRNLAGATESLFAWAKSTIGWFTWEKDTIDRLKISS
jgi:hypothetical protein